MTKRDSPDACCGGTAKRAKTESAACVEEDLTQILAPFTKDLKAIDKECIAEQMRIQREFEQKKKPILEKRDAAIENSPGLWAKIICSCAHLREYIAPPEAELLLKYLRKVKLEDHLDDNGSFTATFIFDDSAAEVFTPVVLTKTVIFKEDDQPDFEKCKVTSISFKEVDTDPRILIKKMENAPEADDDNLSEMAQGSIFEWFSEKDVEHPAFAQFGEIFRRFIYADPIDALGDSEDDSDDEEEQEQEQE